MQDALIVGKILTAFGIKGWVKVRSETDPQQNLFSYSPIYLKNRQLVEFVSFQPHGKGYIAQIKGCSDRNQAELLRGQDLYLSKQALPTLKDGEYYWKDLVGLQVKDLNNKNLGVVDHLIATGANDVLVINGTQEILVPYIQNDVIKSIDLNKNIMVVDWDV